MSVHTPTSLEGNDAGLEKAIVGNASWDSEKTVVSADPEPTVEQVAAPPDGGYGWGKLAPP
jgi:hypothetical protein